jgi:methylated-DNA-[protein]-cysteine S-methyltransferase
MESRDRDGAGLSPGDEQWAEAVLGRAEVGSAPDWAVTRDRLAARAAADDALDVAIEAHEAPFGRMLIAATVAGVVRVALPTEDEDLVIEQLAAKLSPRVMRAPRASITEARSELDEYFAGARRRFDVALDWALVAGFRRQVLDATARIPYGSTASYRQVAVDAGSPKAVRAAGTALATNPLPILVPCHRVLRSDGAVGQYLGGTPMKSALLSLEVSA